MMQAFINGRIVARGQVLEDRAVLVQGGRIVELVADNDLRVSAAQRVDLRGEWLLPGFIDTQVNGGGGALFNEDPTIDTVRCIGKAHRRFGTTGFLPTLISDDLAVVERAIGAVSAAIAAGVPGVLGIHIEGPFLNEARKGVHDPAKFRDLDESALRLLTSLRGGKTLVTLAPEMTTAETIHKLVGAGVIVSAGHTNASYSNIANALHHGLTGFTHLFNAMSPLTSREPGVVGAALHDAMSYCGIIVDGVHVDPVVLQIALSCKPRDRFMLVTDAMANVGTTQESFMLQGRHIQVRDGVCVDEDGTLAGSALDMASAVRNAARLLDIGLMEAVQMASANPAAFLGLSADHGQIAAGCRADLVWADDQLQVIDTWINGRSTREDQTPA
jgi:N-acetylglucosamine-6-phosphate deacetylase